MGIISTGPGSPLAFSSASGGKIYGFNNISEFIDTAIVLPNPGRQKITFHNPGTSDIFIAPFFVQNILGSEANPPSDHAFGPTNAALGGCFRVYGIGGTLVIEGECQGGWAALAVTGAG